MHKLYRSRTERMVAGVCGGLGMYLGLDPTWVRLFFVALVFANGFGFLAYFILAMLMPQAPEGQEIEMPEVPLSQNPQAAKLAGGALILLGVFFFLDNLHLPWLRWVDFDILWPLLLVLAGGALLVRSFRTEGSS
jgi:phage shock protein C